jgi:hypothetical protein
MGHVGHPALVVEEHAYGGRRLPRLAVLGPGVDDERVGVELAPVDQQVGAQGGGTLGAGPHRADDVPLPGPAGRRVGHTAPQVDDDLAVDHHAHAGAHLASLGEVAFELLADAGEPGVACTRDGHERAPLRDLVDFTDGVGRRRVMRSCSTS